MIRPSGPFGPWRSTRATTRSLCSASRMFAGATYRFGWSGPRFSGTTKPWPAGLHESRPTTRFMREGRPTRAPRMSTMVPSWIRRRSVFLSSRRPGPSRERRLASSRTDTGLPRLDRTSSTRSSRLMVLIEFSFLGWEWCRRWDLNAETTSGPAQPVHSSTENAGPSTEADRNTVDGAISSRLALLASRPSERNFTSAPPDVNCFSTRDLRQSSRGAFSSIVSRDLTAGDRPKTPLRYFGAWPAVCWKGRSC